MKSGLTAPFLKRISLLPEKMDRDAFPYSRFSDLLTDDFSLDFNHAVTFFVGENGTGKSTVLEAIAALCGFHAGGGSDWHRLHETADDHRSALVDALRPSWLPKVSKGFFFRSDTFADLARYVDDSGPSGMSDGRGLLERSHGESFFAVFAERFRTNERCMYLMDEPENALSPMRQLGFLSLLHQWESSNNAQVIIATHSPIVLSYPGAMILEFDGETITETTYEETEHFQLTKAFLGNPARYLKELFD